MHSCLSASQTNGLPFREDPTQFRKLSSIHHTHILLVSISYHVALLFFSISYHTVLLFCFYKLYIVTYFFVFLCYMYMYYSVLTSTGKKVFTKLMECYIIMSEFFFFVCLAMPRPGTTSQSPLNVSPWERLNWT